MFSGRHSLQRNRLVCIEFDCAYLTHSSLVFCFFFFFVARVLTLLQEACCIIIDVGRSMGVARPR
jgi:hypothetical protein